MALIDSIDWGSQVTVTGGVIDVYFATNGQVFDGISSLGWTAYEIQQAMLAFTTIEAYIPVTFNRVFTDVGSDFQLVTTTSNDYLGYFNPPGTFNAGVGVFATNWITPGSLEQGALGFPTFLHEFGHGLGLAHPHDTGGTSGVMNGVSSPFNDFGDFDLNQGIFTTMTYNDGWSTAPHGLTPNTGYGYQGTMMALDIALLQSKYGTNTTYNSGNDVYTLPSSNAVGTFYSSIWDSGGIDTIQHVGSTRAFIDLRAATLNYETGGGGRPSYMEGVHGGFTIANGVLIENATGGSGNDVLFGNSANNGLNGGAGDLDIISYFGESSDAIVNLVSNIASSATGGTDTLANIEGATGGSGNDTFYGNALDNWFHGAEGNDIIIGGDGDDTIYGFDDNDWLYGGNDNDTIYAGSGAVDVSNGDAGIDTIYGEDGFDYMYGQSGNDTLRGGAGVDVAYGGSGIDNIYGDSETDWLFGGDDSDNLYGGADPDLLFGEAGSDFIEGGSGNDWLWGGTSSGTGDGISDIFNFLDGWGGDVIYDFEDGLDQFNLSNSSATDFSQLTVGQIAGGFTWFAWGVDVVYLWGADGQAPGVANITADDFLFV